MKKNLVVTITIVTAISLSILTGCGNTQTTSSDPLTTPSTTIEQTINMTDEATTTDTQEATTVESTTEQTELENQDKDPTETQTVHHDAVTHVVHHDAVTHTVHHDGYYTCNSCGATFTSPEAAGAHGTNSMSCYTAGYSGSPGWDEEVVDTPAWDETVVDTPAWDETVEVQVPHTRSVCSECGATK